MAPLRFTQNWFETSNRGSYVLYGIVPADRRYALLLSNRLTIYSIGAQSWTFLTWKVNGSTFSRLQFAAGEAYYNETLITCRVLYALPGDMHNFFKLSKKVDRESKKSKKVDLAWNLGSNLRSITFGRFTDLATETPLAEGCGYGTMEFNRKTNTCFAGHCARIHEDTITKLDTHMEQTMGYPLVTSLCACESRAHVPMRLLYLASGWAECTET